MLFGERISSAMEKAILWDNEGVLVDTECLDFTGALRQLTDIRQVPPPIYELMQNWYCINQIYCVHFHSLRTKSLRGRRMR